MSWMQISDCLPAWLSAEIAEAREGHSGPPSFAAPGDGKFAPPCDSGDVICFGGLLGGIKPAEMGALTGLGNPGRPLAVPALVVRPFVRAKTMSGTLPVALIHRPGAEPEIDPPIVEAIAVRMVDNAIGPAPSLKGESQNVAAVDLPIEVDLPVFPCVGTGNGTGKSAATRGNEPSNIPSCGVVPENAAKLVDRVDWHSHLVLPHCEKRTGTEAPAKWCQGDTALPAQEVHTDKERRIAPASPKAGKGRPSPAVRRSLFAVVEGGLAEAKGGDTSARPYRSTAERGSRSNSLKLVVG